MLIIIFSKIVKQGSNPDIGNLKVALSYMLDTGSSSVRPSINQHLFSEPDFVEAVQLLVDN